MLFKKFLQSVLITVPFALTLSLTACNQTESPSVGEPARPQSLESAPIDRGLDGGRLATPEEVKHLLSMPVAKADGSPEASVPDPTAPLPKTSAVPLPACTIDFNSSSALMYVAEHGYSTFIYSPWYTQQCYGRYWVRGSAVNLDHWHLAAEAASQCFGTNPKWGTPGPKAACLNQTDAMYWPRKAMNMNGATGIAFKAVYDNGTYRNLDLKALYVREGTVKVLAYRVGVGWWQWPNLTPGQRWYWTGNNTNISEVRVFDTNENDTYAIDNLEVAIYP